MVDEGEPPRDDKGDSDSRSSCDELLETGCDSGEVVSVEAEDVLMVTVWLECGLRALLRRRSEEVRIGVVKPWKRLVRMLSAGRPRRYILDRNSNVEKFECRCDKGVYRCG